jgi:diaminopimelate decarboxylase
VLYLKQTRERRFVVVDAGINDLLRPALYGAFHNIWPVLKKDLPAIPMEIVGPVCESSDIFASEREITEPIPGEILAIMDTGAYGFVASSNYNSRCRPPEVLVEGTTYRLIRRRETVSDLILDEADLIV